MACVVAFAGCGGADRPEDVLKEFLEAAEAGDNERACKLLSDGERKFYEQVGSTCEKELSASPNPDVVDEIEAGRFKTERDRGRLIVRPDSGLGGYELVKEDGEWRVASSR